MIFKSVTNKLDALEAAGESAGRDEAVRYRE